MFRSTLAGSVLAVLVAPLVNGLVSFRNQLDDTAPLKDSLAAISTTLVEYESKQSGSEERLNQQLAELTALVSKTHTTGQQQIDQLSKSVEEVRLVALQANNVNNFQDLLNDFSADLEKRMSTMVKAEVEEATEELEPAGVGTLNPATVPGVEDGRPQDFADAARRIVALEKAVAELKARSSVSSSSGSVYYPAQVVSSSGGGSTGSYSGGSTGSYSVGYEPVYSYAVQPTVQTVRTYAAPVTTTVRRGLFGRYTVPRSSGTCRIVNGREVCSY